MNKAKLATVLVIAVTAATVAASFLVSPPAGNDILAFRVNFALSLAVVTLTAGASLVFAMGFGAFTARLRRAYIVISVGLTLFGLAYLQLPVLIAINQYNSIFYTAGIVALPFLGSVMVVYTGTRMLAKLFDIKNIALNYWFVIATILVTGVLVSFLPHAPNPATELQFDITTVLAIWGLAFMGYASYHILLIKRVASVAYMPGLAWLFLGTFLSTMCSGVLNTVSSMALGSANWEVNVLIILAPAVVSGFLYLRSAYLFNQISVQVDTQERTVARNFFGHPLDATKTGHEASSVDIVMYAANLVSNPKAVEPTLNQLRAVTSRLQAGHPATPTEDKELMSVYLELEQYLLERESVRKFDRQTLRQDVAQKLRLTLDAHRTFWAKLSESA